MMENKLTIVIPCRNEEDYIGHCLQSLRTQKNIGQTQIIIANNSTDDTEKVIELYKNFLNIRIIQGGTVSVARNNGARLVRTPYVCFIDGDVRFFNDFILEKTINLLEKKNLHLITGNIRCYDNDIRAKLGFRVFNMINHLLKYTSPFAIGAFMCTRMDKFNEYGGFPEKYPTSEDYFLSRQYDPKKFEIIDDYFGQDSRRFKKMGYIGMMMYLIRNYLNRNNEDYWKQMNGKKYWD